jgi:transposase
MDNDRPPIIHIISRDTGEERCWVVGHANGMTCKGIIAKAIPADGTIVYSDEYRSYHGMAPSDATVNHGRHEWARDDDGDGVREVHCNTCEGAGAALRTFLRGFRGVHQCYLTAYVSTYQALVNAKRVTPALICRMCWSPPPVYDYWV